MTPRAVILDVFVRLLYPLMLAASVWILLRGHNEPGGGFIGGMVAVAATAMLAVAQGAEPAQRRMPLGPVRLAAAGVLLSLLAGLPAFAQGDAYMTHLWGSLPLGFATLKVSTVLAFDVGVFAAVWGALGGLCAQMVGLDEDAGGAGSSLRPAAGESPLLPAGRDAAASSGAEAVTPSPPAAGLPAADPIPRRGGPRTGTAQRGGSVAVVSSVARGASVRGRAGPAPRGGGQPE